MTNILYFHGFGSSFDPSSEKIKTLSTLGKVSGYDIDYTAGASAVIDAALAEIGESDSHYDLLVGTSMGGWLAMVAGRLSGVPFVAMNPCMDPDVSLLSYKGEGIDYAGRSYKLTEDHIKSYFTPDPQNGIVLLDKCDEVIPYTKTVEQLKRQVPHYLFDGGSHRFDSTKKALPLIDHLITASRYSL